MGNNPVNFGDPTGHYAIGDGEERDFDPNPNGIINNSRDSSNEEEVDDAVSSIVDIFENNKTILNGQSTPASGCGVIISCGAPSKDTSSPPQYYTETRPPSFVGFAWVFTINKYGIKLIWNNAPDSINWIWSEGGKRIIGIDAPHGGVDYWHFNSNLKGLQWLNHKSLLNFLLEMRTPIIVAPAQPFINFFDGKQPIIT